MLTLSAAVYGANVSRGCNAAPKLAAQDLPANSMFCRLLFFYFSLSGFSFSHAVVWTFPAYL